VPTPEHIRERRELERRRRRRVRTVVFGALAVFAALVVAVLAGAFESDDSPVTTANSRARTPAKLHPAAKTPATRPATATGTYRGPVPILMYHVISAPPAGIAYPELWTPRERFRATIGLLEREGYTGVTIDQVRRAWAGGPGLPAKPVVLTFDDGYISQLTHAKPALRALGWPGVLYLEGKNLGPGGLTAHQVRSMIAAGWEVGAHTLTHPDLTTVDDAALEREIAGSRELLQRRLGVPVTAFCYPAGRNDARVRAAVRAAGFTTATTVEPGIAAPGDDPFALPRIRVNGTDSPQTVLDHVRTGTGAQGSYGA
jgi:peptidoglycan/xylan/chitin deacetylase (PgdA/CDA1 family)